jgi:TPR repeat protein
MNKSKLYIIAEKYEEEGKIDKAYQFYLEAALSENDADAMYKLGHMYYEGDYVSQDYDKAGYYFGMAYDNDADGKAWTLILAGSYWEKRAEESGDKNALKRAIDYYQAAADHGIGYGNECLGKIYYDLGEYDKAYKSLLLMEERNPLGYYYMGKLYEEGHGVEKNIQTAIDYYKKAVEVGSEHEEEYGEDRDTALARARLKELKELDAN